MCNIYIMFQLLSVSVLHWVVEHNILFSQLQQHRVVKELVDAHIFAQTLVAKDKIHCNHKFKACELPKQIIVVFFVK